MKVLALVILYKMDPERSETIKTIIDANKDNIDIDLYIWDNGPVEIDKRWIDQVPAMQFSSITYRWTPENTALSKIYNEVVSLKCASYYVFLDQDTILPVDYFVTIAHEVSLSPGMPLILPRVYSGERLVSPGLFRTVKGKHAKDMPVGWVCSRNITAITSGMCINRGVFVEDKLIFDEKLDFYCIDTDFMLRFREKYKSVFVSSNVLRHSTALWSTQTADEMLSRFQRWRSGTIIMQKKRRMRWRACVYMAYLSIKYSIKYRDVRFIRGILN